MSPYHRCRSGLGGSVISAGNVSQWSIRSNVLGEIFFPGECRHRDDDTSTALDVNGDITDRNLLSQNCIGTNATGTLVVGLAPCDVQPTDRSVPPP